MKLSNIKPSPIQHVLITGLGSESLFWGGVCCKGSPALLGRWSPVIGQGLTLEEEAAGLLSGGGGDGEPHYGVRPHGLRPQFALHFGVEVGHGQPHG